MKKCDRATMFTVRMFYSQGLRPRKQLGRVSYLFVWFQHHKTQPHTGIIHASHVYTTHPPRACLCLKSNMQTASSAIYHICHPAALYIRPAYILGNQTSSSPFAMHQSIHCHKPMRTRTIMHPSIHPSNGVTNIFLVSLEPRQTASRRQCHMSHVLL